MMSQAQPLGVEVGGRRYWDSDAEPGTHLGWTFPDAAERATTISRSQERINQTRRIIARTSGTVDRARTMKINSARVVDDSHAEMAAQTQRLAERYGPGWATPLPGGDGAVDDPSASVM